MRIKLIVVRRLGQGNTLVNLWKQFDNLTSLNKFFVICPLLGFALAVLLWLYPHDATDHTVKPSPTNSLLVIDTVTESMRGPVWGHPGYDDDEIIAVIRGSCTALGTKPNDFKLVAFWRLASGYETNWHIAGRRVGGNYKLATLDGESAVAGNWDFLIGRIEAEKTYSGDISVILLAFGNDQVTNNQEEWLDDSNGWGAEDLPTDGRLAMSAPRTFATKANR